MFAKLLDFPKIFFPKLKKIKIELTLGELENVITLCEKQCYIDGFTEVEKTLIDKLVNTQVKESK